VRQRGVARVWHVGGTSIAVFVALSLAPMTGGGTDAAYARRSGKATVVESFGLAGFGYHARDEYIEIDSIVPRLYLVTRLLTTL